MTLLDVDCVTKHFGGLTAVSRFSLSVAAGEMVGLIGPNGAGKTTVFHLLSGFHTPTEGDIRFKGVSIVGVKPHAICRRGLARTFQIVQPFAGLSVRENIAVGAHLSRPARADALEAAGEVARAVGLGDQLDKSAASLTVAARKRLELARALATGPKLLLLDEVLAGLNPSEIRDMVPVISAIRARGVTILMIEHVMQAVMSLAEQVWVLAEGRIIAQGAPREVAGNPRVVEAYLGHGAASRLVAGGAGVQ